MRKLLLLAEVACVLCGSLLAVLLIGQWLNLSHLTARVSANSTTDCAKNLRLLSQAVSAYTQDYDETLPPMQNAQVFQAAVRPFAVSAAVFYCPETGLPYTPNAALSGRALNSLSGDYNTIEEARDSQPHADGLYTVLHLDGTVQHGTQIVGDPNDIVVGRAKQLGLAVQQYAQDSDETLPPMHTLEEFQTALAPYTRSHAVFYSPNGKPFVPNAALSGVRLVSIDDPSTTLLLMDQPPYVGGAPTLLYVDGHVEHKTLFYQHILWTNTSGRMALWTYSDGTGAYTNLQYGPYPGWSARAIADGTDGSPRILWTNTNGQATVWTVNTATGGETQFDYGPYPGWSAKSVAVGSDNVTHLLWGNVSGEAALWTLDSAGRISDSHAGPYPGWSPTAIAIGPDNKERLLWNSTSGRAALWTLPTANTSSFIDIEYGPYAGWSAKSVAVGADNVAHLQWGNVSGEVALWTLDSVGAISDSHAGPYPGWSGTAIAFGSDNQERLLWNNINGQVSLWMLPTASTSSFTQLDYGPYPGWSAVGVSASR